MSKVLRRKNSQKGSKIDIGDVFNNACVVSLRNAAFS